MSSAWNTIWHTAQPLGELALTVPLLPFTLTWAEDVLPLWITCLESSVQLVFAAAVSMVTDPGILAPPRFSQHRLWAYSLLDTFEPANCRLPFYLGLRSLGGMNGENCHTNMSPLTRELKYLDSKGNVTFSLLSLFWATLEGWEDEEPHRRVESQRNSFRTWEEPEIQYI